MAGPQPAPRRARHPLDGAAVLTAVLALMMLLPSRLVFGPLGAAGSPSSLLAILCGLWWLNVTLVQGGYRIAPHRPVRILSGLLILAALASYIAATTRPIDAVELRAADRGLLRICAWVGLMLLAAEGMDSRERLDALLRRFVAFGAVMAAIGVLQFFSGVDITQWINVPGLSSNIDYPTLLSRGGLNRPASTTLHPIEFGVVMAAVLPIAVHYAFEAERARRLKWAGVVLIASAAIMSVSRSAVIGMVLASIVLIPTWSPARRRRILTSALVLVVVMRFAVHGLIGTILGLFTGFFTDTSTGSRVTAYAAVATYVEQRPIFGRGLATFLPSYYILDNQYLGTLIEMGLVGLLVLLAILISGVVEARVAAVRAVDASRRDLAYSLCASAVVSVVAFGTFDALSFSTAAAVAFFIVGCCAGVARLGRVEALEGRLRAGEHPAASAAGDEGPGARAEASGTAGRVTEVR
jgi:polysaccharide biosynthesis protein PslJ